MNLLRQEKLDNLIVALIGGASIRGAARASGVSKTTAREYARWLRSPEEAERRSQRREIHRALEQMIQSGELVEDAEGRVWLAERFPVWKTLCYRQPHDRLCLDCEKGWWLEEATTPP